MADDPGLAALCLADCPMSNPAVLSSLCSLCSLQGFCSLLCILMASSSLQDCISLSQGSTTTSVAVLIFPASAARARTALGGSCQGHKDTKGSWAAHQLSLQGKPVGPASKPQKGSSPCFRRAKVSAGRCPPASSQGSVSPKSLSALRLTGSPCLRDIQSYYQKKGGQQFFSCLWWQKHFCLSVGSIDPLCVPALRLCP